MPYNLNIEGHFFISCMENRPASLARRGCFILPEGACGEGNTQRGTLFPSGR